MVKTKVVTVKISPEQEQILIAKAKSAGFMKKSDYIRFALFMSFSMEEKINKIYEKVCQDGD